MELKENPSIAENETDGQIQQKMKPSEQYQMVQSAADQSEVKH